MTRKPVRAGGSAGLSAQPGGRLRAGLVGRASWSFADQALSSLSNAALSLLIAKATSVEGYGYFAVAFTIYTFLLGVSRGMANQPYLMRLAGVDHDQANVGARASTGLALMLGVLCTVVLVPAALFFGGIAGVAVATMALALPGLLVQDVWRSVFIARQRPRSAVANDALFAVIQFTGLVVAVAAGVSEPVPLIMIWTLAGWVAAGAAICQGGGLPSVGDGVDFARRNRDLSRYLVAEWLTVLGAAQVALLLVGALGSAADVGSLRAAWTLLGPLTILVVGTFSFLVPELVRHPRLPGRSLRRVAVAVSGVLVVVTLAWGLAMLRLPEDAGRAVLGDVWPGARMTLLSMTLWMVGAALSTGPITVIRACGYARPSFTVNVLIGVLLLICTPAGFLLAGAPGAAAGFAVANLAPAPLFWVQMELVLRRRQASAGNAPTLSDDGGPDPTHYPGSG